MTDDMIILTGFWLFVTGHVGLLVGAILLLRWVRRAA